MWKSIKAKHENSNKVKLPYKQKKFFPTGWDYQAIDIDYQNKIIKLTKANYIDSLGKIHKSKPVKCKAKFIPQNIVEIELIYKDKLYLAIKYKELNMCQQINSNNEAAIDLGEIHSITSIDNNKNAIIITGRKIREIKQLRNKELAKLKHRRSKCTKNSKQYRKYSKAINNLKVKTDKKILDCVHKTSKLYLDYCLINNIKIVYYGDLDDCVRGTKDENRGSTFTRQKLSQWCFGLLMLHLQNKLSRCKIELIKVKEYYTSKKCPACNKLNSPNGRNYECSHCGYKIHRDINGAINILNDNSEYRIIRYNNLKYLQIS